MFNVTKQHQFLLASATLFSGLLSVEALNIILGTGFLASGLGLLLQGGVLVGLGSLSKIPLTFRPFVLLAVAPFLLLSSFTASYNIYVSGGYELYANNLLLATHSKASQVAQQVFKLEAKAVRDLQNDLRLAESKITWEADTGQFGLRKTGCGSVCNRFKKEAFEKKLVVTSRQIDLLGLQKNIRAILDYKPNMTARVNSLEETNENSELPLAKNTDIFEKLTQNRHKVVMAASATYMVELRNLFEGIDNYTHASALAANAQYKAVFDGPLGINRPLKQILNDITSVLAFKAPKPGFFEAAWGIVPDLVSVYAAIAIYIIETGGSAFSLINLITFFPRWFVNLYNRLRNAPMEGKRDAVKDGRDRILNYTEDELRMLREIAANFKSIHMFTKWSIEQIRKEFDSLFEFESDGSYSMVYRPITQKNKENIDHFKSLLRGLVDNGYLTTKRSTAHVISASARPTGKLKIKKIIKLVRTNDTALLKLHTDFFQTLLITPDLDDLLRNYGEGEDDIKQDTPEDDSDGPSTPSSNGEGNVVKLDNRH